MDLLIHTARIRSCKWRLLLGLTKLLYVDGLNHLLAVRDRRLLKCLTAAKLADDACLFKFALEFLKRFLDVLAFLYLYDNHVLILIFCFIPVFKSTSL